MIRTASLLLALSAASALGATNIDPQHKHAWQENTGWTNWRDANGGAQGVSVLGDHLAGFIWCENIGFINVGSGGGPYAPTASQTGADFGVNIDPGTGELSGYAWGENVGWINFDTASASYDASARRFRGHAWGENIGWLNLYDTTHFVASACVGDFDASGTIDSGDLAVMLAAWDGAGPADLNGSGVVDSSDLAILLAAWGPCD